MKKRKYTQRDSDIRQLVWLEDRMFQLLQKLQATALEVDELMGMLRDILEEAVNP